MKKLLLLLLPAWLIGAPAPDITINVTAGSNATFAYTSDGTPPMTVSWHKDNVPVTGAQYPTFTLTGIVAADAGAYSAYVTNKAGSAMSNKIILAVVAAPAEPPRNPAATVTVSSPSPLATVNAPVAPRK